MFAQAFKVKLYAALDQLLGISTRIAHDTQTWQVRAVGTPACRCLLVDDDVLSHVRGPFNPACRRMLPSVPLGISLLAFPAMVTLPGLREWR
jgi:hypothetical protein